MASAIGCICQGTGYDEILVHALEKSSVNILHSRAFPMINTNITTLATIPRINLVKFDEAIKILQNYQMPASFYGIQFHLRQRERKAFSMIVHPMDRFTYLSFDFGFEQTIIQLAESRFTAIVGVKPEKLQIFTQHVGNATSFKFKAYTIGVLAFWVNQSVDPGFSIEFNPT